MDALAKQVETRTVYVVNKSVCEDLGGARWVRDLFASRGLHHPIIKRTITEEEVE